MEHNFAVSLDSTVSWLGHSRARFGRWVGVGMVWSCFACGEAQHTDGDPETATTNDAAVERADPSTDADPASGASGVGRTDAGTTRPVPRTDGGSVGLPTDAASATPAADGGASLATDGGSVRSGDAGSPGAACDRACLTDLNTKYLEAVLAHDASKLPTAPDVRFTENGKQLALNAGLWSVAKSLGRWRQDFAEVLAGQTAGFVSLDDDNGTALLAFRLKVVDRRVTEIETTLCRQGEATFFSPNNLTMRVPLYDMEVEPAQRASREKLVEVVDLYFQALESGDGSKIPFDNSASRNENGAVTASGSRLSSVSQFSYIDKIERRYVLVDVERGNVLPWVLFQIPMGIGGGSRTLHLAELFKVAGGKIMGIHAVMVNQPLGTPSGWE